MHQNAPHIEDDILDGVADLLAVAQQPQASPLPEGMTGAEPGEPVDSEVHAEVRRLWRQLQDDGHPQPSWRQMRDALKERGVRIGSTQLTTQLQRLRATDLATPQASDAVTTAEAQRATTRQAVAAVMAEQLAAEADMDRLDHDLATLQVRAARGDVQAAEGIAEAERAQWTLRRKLTVHLPEAKQTVDAEEVAAKRALEAACITRDIEDYNRLATAEAARAREVMTAADQLHEKMVAYLSHALAQRTIAGRLAIPYGERHTSPERRLASYIHTRFEAVAPPYPRSGARSPMPHVNDLIESSTTSHPLSPADVAALRGQGMVWAVYRGTALVSWIGCGQRPVPTQQAFQHHQAIELSLADYAILHARYGEDLVVVPPPVWEP